MEGLQRTFAALLLGLALLPAGTLPAAENGGERVAFLKVTGLR